MSPTTFTLRAQEANMSYRGVGLTAARGLASLPVPFTVSRNRWHTIKSAIDARSQAALIRHGFAVLNRDKGRIEITPKGRGYLIRLKTAKVLP